MCVTVYVVWFAEISGYHVASPVALVSSPGGLVVGLPGFSVIKYFAGSNGRL